MSGGQQYSPYTPRLWVRHDRSCLISGGKATFGRRLHKTSWGEKNPKITAAPCGSPFRIREPSRWDSQTDNSIRRAGFTGKNFAFMCLCIINSNGIMILRFLDALKCSGPSNIPTPWFERQPGLGKDEAHNFALYQYSHSLVSYFLWTNVHIR